MESQIAFMKLPPAKCALQPYIGDIFFFNAHGRILVHTYFIRCSLPFVRLIWKTTKYTVHALMVHIVSGLDWDCRRYLLINKGPDAFVCLYIFNPLFISCRTPASFLAGFWTFAELLLTNFAPMQEPRQFINQQCTRERLFTVVETHKKGKIGLMRKKFI